MIGHVGSLMPFLVSPALCEEIFQDGKDHVIAGSGQPVGTAERVPADGGLPAHGHSPAGARTPSGSWALA
jgi:hypothetical protein